MVPEGTQEATDCLPKAQSKSGTTQLDDPVTMASTNVPEENESIGHTSVTVPEVLTASDCQERVQSSEAQVCDIEMPQAPDEDVSLRIPEVPQPRVAEAAFTELPLNVEESALIREEYNGTSHDADAILDQEIPQEFAFPSPDPAATLDIQGSARSDQGAQGTCSTPSSSEQLTSRAASSVNHSEVVNGGGVQPPNISSGGSTVNALADTSLPNNLTGQNLQMHLFSNPYDYELERLRREEENLKKNFEETTSVLMAEFEREMAEARSKYDRESQELDAAYNAKAMEAEANRSFVEMSSLLGNAFMSKCTERSESIDLPALRAAIVSQYSIQQQQAVQTNTHMNSTSPPRPSVTAAEAPISNPSGPLLHFPPCTTTQPTPISQQAVQTNTHMNTTASPRPSVTAAETPIPNLSGPLSHFPPCTTSQPTPISQQPAVQANTHMNSTAPPRPSLTAAEAPIPNLSGPLSHFPLCTTSQPTPISQQTAVQANTHMNSTAPPPSVTAAEPPIPNLSGPLSHFPRCTTSQPTPISQQAAVQANTHMNSTALPRLLVTSEALSLHSPRSNAPQPRPPPIISNLTPSSSSPPVHGIVRAPAPHVRPFRSSRAPNSASAPTTHPSRLVQEQQQQQGNSNGGLVYLSDDDE